MDGWMDGWIGGWMGWDGMCGWMGWMRINGGKNEERKK
jgi:hypothetical protein